MMMTMVMVMVIVMMVMVMVIMMMVMVMMMRGTSKAELVLPPFLLLWRLICDSHAVTMTVTMTATHEFWKKTTVFPKFKMLPCGSDDDCDDDGDDEGDDDSDDDGDDDDDDGSGDGGDDDGYA